LGTSRTTSRPFPRARTDECVARDVEDVGVARRRASATRAGGTRGAAVADDMASCEEGCEKSNDALANEECRYIVATTLRVRVEFVQMVAFAHFEG